MKHPAGSGAGLGLLYSRRVLRRLRGRREAHPVSPPRRRASPMEQFEEDPLPISAWARTCSRENRLDRRASRSPPHLDRPADPAESQPAGDRAGRRRWAIRRGPTSRCFTTASPCCRREASQASGIPRSFRSRHLVKGVNRFAVMAALQDACNSLSDPVEVPYDGPGSPAGCTSWPWAWASTTEPAAAEVLQGPMPSESGEVLNARGLDTAGNSGDAHLSGGRRSDAGEDRGRHSTGSPRRSRTAPRTRSSSSSPAIPVSSTPNRFCLLLPPYPFPPGGAPWSPPAERLPPRRRPARSQGVLALLGHRA